MSPALSNNPIQGEDNLNRELQSRNEGDYLYGAIEGTSATTQEYAEQTDRIVRPDQTLKRAAGSSDRTNGEIDETTNAFSEIVSAALVDTHL